LNIKNHILMHESNMFVDGYHFNVIQRHTASFVTALNSTHGIAKASARTSIKRQVAFTIKK